jgi:hypothetical protein
LTSYFSLCTPSIMASLMAVSSSVR